MKIKTRLEKLEAQHPEVITPQAIRPVLTPNQWMWVFSPGYQGAMPEFSDEVKAWAIKFGGKSERIKQLQLQPKSAVQNEH